MDIEKIEAMLTKLNGLVNWEEDVPATQAILFTQCQLLLHIYQKLESIEKKLEPVQPITVHRSGRVY